MSDEYDNNENIIEKKESDPVEEQVENQQTENQTINGDSDNTVIDEAYSGYSNENGYVNEDSADKSYSSVIEDSANNQKQDEHTSKIIDKRAAKAARKQERQRAKAARKQDEAYAPKKTGFIGKMFRFVVAALVFGIIAGATMIGMGYGYNHFTNDYKSISKTQVSSVNVAAKEEESKVESDADTDNTSKGNVTITDVSDVVEKVMPSVVSITSTEVMQAAGSDDFWSYFYGNGSGSGNGSEYESKGAGSGIIIGENDTELLIVTNQHVVADADKLSVQFDDEKSVDANVKSINEKQDLAIVSIPLDDIKSETLDKIKIATLGSSDSMKVGEGSIAIGNALGYGQSVTTGVISAVDRTITVDNYDRKVIQTDAAINPGNSGGALLNMNGELIGINCAKSVENYSEGMGYAIPISHVKDLLGDMMTQETKQKVDAKEKGYLNIYGKDVTSDLSEMYDIPEGVYIMDVIKKGAAEKAGLAKYDVITALDGKSVTSMKELQAALEYYKKDEKVKLTIQTLENKSYKEKEVEVTLGEEMK